MLLENSLVYSFKVENTHSLWLSNCIPQQKPTEMHIVQKKPKRNAYKVSTIHNN